MQWILGNDSGRNKKIVLVMQTILKDSCPTGKHHYAHFKQIKITFLLQNIWDVFLWIYLFFEIISTLFPKSQRLKLYFWEMNQLPAFVKTFDTITFLPLVTVLLHILSFFRTTPCYPGAFQCGYLCCSCVCVCGKPALAMLFNITVRQP